MRRSSAAAKPSTGGLDPAAQRRKDLLQLLAVVEPQIEQLDKALEQAAKANPQAVLLMSQRGVGPITSLAFAVTIGEVSRFAQQTGGQLSRADPLRTQLGQQT